MAQSLKNVKDLVFAQGDVTANDFENLEIVDLPTIMFYPSKNKANPVKFSTIPSSDNLLNFLKNYVT